MGAYSISTSRPGRLVGAIEAALSTRARLRTLAAVDPSGSFASSRRDVPGDSIQRRYRGRGRSTTIGPGAGRGWR